MKINLKKVLLVTSLLLSGAANAGGISTGVPSNVLVLPDSNLVFFSAGEHLRPASCATNATGTWALSTATSGGKTMYALILTAMATETSITVEGFGTGNCDIWSDREAARFAYTQ